MLAFLVLKEMSSFFFNINDARDILFIEWLLLKWDYRNAFVDYNTYVMYIVKFFDFSNENGPF